MRRATPIALTDEERQELKRATVRQRPNRFAAERLAGLLRERDGRGCPPHKRKRGARTIVHALVSCCDEKSRIQALDRTQPSLPFGRGRCGTITHDCKRHGTTTLFAGLELAAGRLIGPCQRRHRHQEWLKFLKKLDGETPAELDLHLIVDNCATHKHEKVKRWLARRPR